MTVALLALLDWVRARFARPAARLSDVQMQEYLDACDVVGWPT